MEGEPPWMVSAFRPDPRLPPEQQLLPTVAKRLQQEKWEREGKVGNVYDKEFRPLTDEGFLEPPEHPIVAPEHEPAENENENENLAAPVLRIGDGMGGDWRTRTSMGWDWRTRMRTYENENENESLTRAVT